LGYLPLVAKGCEQFCRSRLYNGHGLGAFADGLNYFTHGTDETDTLAREGPNQPLFVATVADRGSCGIDPAGNRGLRHDPPTPNRIQQVVLGDDVVAMANEVLQEVEDLGLQRN
jgi:hypothetical protein